ncbi:MAG: radical SAM domain-containing protein [Elusimicrobia bacterium]|nr:MAG: radical SAM domain-containing protein [Elusimicrobiota bacterium]KAF0155356.1 MAG: radical SAM domain-containing protein [Elusimicrobiota bacterium]
MEAKGKCYELILNYDCNARCAFCSQGGFDRSLNAPYGALARGVRRAWKEGYRRLGLTGGEPLVSPHILKVIALGRSSGFRFIRVQTNGIKLADPAVCLALVKAGLTFCKFSFTSDRAAEHDALTGVPGALGKALKGLEILRKLGIRLGNNILVNRLNYRRLPEIIRFYLERGISNFVVIYPVYNGAMASNAKRLGVSLPDCAPYFREAAGTMEAAGLPGEILFLNTPPCFLKGRESLAIGLDKFNTLVTDPAGGRSDLDENAEEGKEHGPPCRRCALAARCRGADRNYAELYGWRGFRPFKSPPRPYKEESGRPGPVFLSDNERCMTAILEGGGWKTTAAVLAFSKKMAICRDCSDGNAVLGAGLSLEKKGLIQKKLERGVFLWRLAPAARKRGGG